eukprot:53369-Chlamydomonas_euryale.AAC.1
MHFDSAGAVSSKPPSIQLDSIHLASESLSPSSIDWLILQKQHPATRWTIRFESAAPQLQSSRLKSREDGFTKSSQISAGHTVSCSTSHFA